MIPNDLSRKIFLMMALAFGTLAAFADNPLHFHEYKQVVTLEFATEQETQSANVCIRPLPAHYKMALSARWDDSNPAHLNTHAIMARHGCPGTFYLCTMLPELCEKLPADGCSLGMHTKHHPFLNFMRPFDIFREFMENRIELEVATQQPANSSVLPFGAWCWEPYPEIARSVGSGMMSAGIICTPESTTGFHKVFQDRLGYPDKTLAMSRLLLPGDNNPNLAKLEEQLTDYLASDVLQAHPSISMSMHSWHSEEGRRNLDKAFERLSGNPDWWYCNQTEYGAYRYEALNDSIQMSVQGNILRIEVTRMEPAET